MVIGFIDYHQFIGKTHIIGAIAQLGERLPCTQEVGGSIPPGSTIFGDSALESRLFIHNKRHSVPPRFDKNGQPVFVLRAQVFK